MNSHERAVQLLQQRDDLKAENDRLRGLLREAKVDLRIAAKCMNPLTPVHRQFNDTADRIDALLVNHSSQNEAGLSITQDTGNPRNGETRFPTGQPPAINQCDGCARGLPVVGGIHRGEGYDMIACTADRYEAQPSAAACPECGLSDAHKMSCGQAHESKGPRLNADKPSVSKLMDPCPHGVSIKDKCPLCDG